LLETQRGDALWIMQDVIDPRHGNPTPPDMQQLHLRIVIECEEWRIG
jgi:hypothetical protein